MFSLCSLTKGPRMPCPWFDKGCTFGHRKTDFFFLSPLWHLLNVQTVHSPSGHNVILLAQRKQNTILRKPIEIAPQKHVPRKKEKAGRFLSFPRLIVSISQRSILLANTHVRTNFKKKKTRFIFIYLFYLDFRMCLCCFFKTGKDTS